MANPIVFEKRASKVNGANTELDRLEAYLNEKKLQVKNLNEREASVRAAIANGSKQLADIEGTLKTHFKAREEKLNGLEAELVAQKAQLANLVEWYTAAVKAVETKTFSLEEKAAALAGIEAGLLELRSSLIDKGEEYFQAAKALEMVRLKLKDIEAAKAREVAEVKEQGDLLKKLTAQYEDLLSVTVSKYEKIKTLLQLAQGWEAEVKKIREVFSKDVQDFQSKRDSILTTLKEYEWRAREIIRSIEIEKGMAQCLSTNAQAQETAKR